ncbi:hypothetical protein KJ762_13210 [bacterium]|nr:hypothetical protein [bacterium]MBU1635450.1 hypothetical protein [bacterium]MBU1874415.1 hypothetical protein [bacterium]
MRNIRAIIFLLIICTLLTFAQNNIHELHGDRKFRKQGLHNGNLVETLFWNFGEVAWWGKEPSGVWPRGSQHSYMDGIYPIVAAEVALTGGDTIHIVEGGFREHYETGPTGTEFSWQPLPGFSDPEQDYIAMSDDPNTWPEYWPDQPSAWRNVWNGYFGQRTNADQESYFVVDDYQDHGRNFNGLFFCNQYDSTRGGLGMRMAVRGFQWSNVLAEDIIFWHYDITNISTTHYNKAVFGMYADAGVGGQNDSNDDNAFYDLNLDLAYTWDANGLGDGNWQTGYCGYAFLESPGNPFDGIDNDGDGSEGTGPSFTSSDFQARVLSSDLVVIDYSNLEPDNNWGRKLVSFNTGGDDSYYRFVDDTLFVKDGDVEHHYIRNQTVSEKPFNGIDDDLDGIIDENENVHAGLKYRDWINGSGFDNYLIDENRSDGIDNDGDWDPDLNDLGADGVGGTGDYGEGDGLPTDGEPNFDKTDKDESDQIGLTAFDSFYIGQGVEFQYDEVIWERIANYHFDTGSQNGNIAFLFGSGPFIMPPGHTERFSLALVFGENFNDLKRNKEVVQDIYNANYNFARPPIKPELTVVPGDGKVTLYWDNAAENSYDEFANPTNNGYDFEGYRIYRSSDEAFNDAYIITNGYGEATFYEPFAVFDLQDSVKGFFEVDVDGSKYYLGSDNGLQHSFVDTDVINGKTYYYAVVSYDQGWAEKFILPSECTKTIFKDINGNVTTDRNTAVVIPNAPAAGYQAPETADGIVKVQGWGSGDILLDFIDPRFVNIGDYLLSFDDTTHQDTLTYSLFELTTDYDTNVIFGESTALTGEDSNPMFNGMRIRIKNDIVTYNDTLSIWKTGSKSNLIYFASMNSYWNDKLEIRSENFPTRYEIHFGVSDSSFLKTSFKHETNFRVWDVITNKKVRAYLWESSDQMDSLLTDGDYIQLHFQDGRFNRETWKIQFIAPEGVEPIQPGLGDTAIIAIDLPFRNGDIFSFKTFAAKDDPQIALNNIDRVAVVPNPYVAAAAWEPRRMLASGRGERRVYFIHLPSRCTIRIYTQSGDHIKTIYHESSADDGSEAWNLTTKDGLDLAAGIYYYHVDAGESGDFTGKFAVIK